MDFSDILFDLMEELQLNQVQFAQKLGVKQGQVSDWLNGKNKPNYSTIRKICLTFDIPGERILGLDGHYPFPIDKM